MVTEALAHDQLWLSLWSHAAHTLILTVAPTVDCDIFTAGHGWGLRQRRDPRHAFLIHPAGSGREVGDLALTVQGSTTQVLPRYGQSYPDYLASVQDIIETVAQA